MVYMVYEYCFLFIDALFVAFIWVWELEVCFWDVFFPALSSLCLHHFFLKTVVES